MPPRPKPGSIKPRLPDEAYDEKIVRRMPLQELWDDKGMIKAERGVRSIDASEVRALLEKATFVVARIASKLEWIEEGAKKDFWYKNKRLIYSSFSGENAGKDIDRAGYGYHATEWREASGKVFVVFEEYPGGREY
jgi:hypothetical protein